MSGRVSKVGRSAMGKQDIWFMVPKMVNSTIILNQISHKRAKYVALHTCCNPDCFL